MVKDKIDNSKCLISFTITLLYSLSKSLQFWGIKNKGFKVLKISPNPSKQGKSKQGKFKSFSLLPLYSLSIQTKHKICHLPSSPCKSCLLEFEE